GFRDAEKTTPAPGSSLRAPNLPLPEPGRAARAARVEAEQQKPQRSSGLARASPQAHIAAGSARSTPAARAAARSEQGGARRGLRVPARPTAAQRPPRPTPAQGAGARPGAGPGCAAPGPTGPLRSRRPRPRLRGAEERGGRRTLAAPHARRFPQFRVRARARPKSRGLGEAPERPGLLRSDRIPPLPRPPPSPPPNPLPQLAALPPKKQRRQQQEAAARRRKDYAPDGPASRGSSAGRSPAAAARDALHGGSGKRGPGHGERNANRPPSPSSLPPPIRRPPSRLPSPPPPAKPRMEPPPTRRRLAPGDGFVRRPEPRRQAQPPPPPRGAPALTSQNRLPVWPGPSACLHPEPWDGGHSSSLLPPPLPEPFVSSSGPRPPLRLPGARAGGGTWAPAPGGRGGARLPVADAAAAGGVEEAPLGSLGCAVLPAAASASRCCCCCCRRGRCLRRGGGGGGAFPVRLR
ncbi:translation initiation factor IF-2-like, partial [Daubentonia madagascariensis]